MRVRRSSQSGMSPKKLVSIKNFAAVSGHSEFWGRKLMFLLVLVTCVTLENQTMCHEFPREAEFASQDACHIAAALERGRYNSRI